MRIELPAPLQNPACLAELLGASIEARGQVSERFSGIATDTREIQAGDLFLAMKGEKTDGARYVREALALGACGVLAESASEIAAQGAWILLCDSVQDALLCAAGKWRQICGAKVIAVTGSAGKTTTKEAIACVLGDVPHNAGNYNSTLGMPLAVLSFPKSEYWVCELGINHIGEMEKMATALRPNIGVITNVGSAHIGNFGDFATLLQEKFKICAGMNDAAHLVLPIAMRQAIPPFAACHAVCVGEEESAEFLLENIAMSEHGVRCDLRSAQEEITNLVWPIPGTIGKSVLGIAGAVGMLCGRTSEQIRVGLKKSASAPLRTRAYPVGEMLFLEDCYNASPEACLAALETLRYLSGKRARVAVLGDMLELGNYACFLHRALGGALPQADVSYLFTYGALAAQIACGAKEAGMPSECIFSFALGEEGLLARSMLKHLPPDAAVLFKASRAMRMERVVEEIRRLL